MILGDARGQIHLQNMTLLTHLRPIWDPFGFQQTSVFPILVTLTNGSKNWQVFTKRLFQIDLGPLIQELPFGAFWSQACSKDYSDYKYTGGKLAAEYRGKTSRFPLSGNDVAIAWSNPVLVSPWPWLHHRSWLRTKGCGLMTIVCTMVWPCANKHGQRLFL